jgi:hypothetical protein
MTDKTLKDKAISIQYLAGLIDGEGYVGIRRCLKKEKGRKDQLEFKPTVVIANTNYNLMLMLKKTFYGSICKKNLGLKILWKQSYSFEFNRTEIKEILPKLIPYLIIKKEQAILVMDLFKTYKNHYGVGHAYTKEQISKKEELHIKSLKLNKRGI